jgi:hypothetical protein
MLAAAELSICSLCCCSLRVLTQITTDVMAHYRNTGGFDMLGSGRDKIESPAQMAASLAVCKELDLDGLIVIGGDDSNTNAAILAEYFAANGCKTSVCGCPKVSCYSSLRTLLYISDRLYSISEQTSLFVVAAVIALLQPVLSYCAILTVCEAPSAVCQIAAATANTAVSHNHACRLHCTNAVCYCTADH